GTKDYRITYKHNGGNKIHGFGNSSYGINTQEGKGTTGIIFYYATAAATQALWLKRLLSKLTHSEEEKVTIRVDNKSAIRLMKNPVFHGRSKHIDTKKFTCKLQQMMQDIAASLLMEFDKWVLDAESGVIILKTPLESQDIPVDNRYQSEDPTVMIGKFCDLGHRWLGSKTISNCVEALVGAYYVDGELTGAIHCMNWLGKDVIQAIEEKLGYEFGEKGLLLEAITHASCQDQGVGYCYQVKLYTLNAGRVKWAHFIWVILILLFCLSTVVKGEDIRYDITLEFTDAIFRTEKEFGVFHLETCDACTGTGAKVGTKMIICSSYGGRGQVMRTEQTPFGMFSQVSVCPKCNGSGEMISEYCRKVKSKKPPGAMISGFDLVEFGGSCKRMTTSAATGLCKAKPDGAYGIVQPGLCLLDSKDSTVLYAPICNDRKLETDRSRDRDEELEPKAKMLKFFSAKRAKNKRRNRVAHSVNEPQEFVPNDTNNSNKRTVKKRKVVTDIRDIVKGQTTDLQSELHLKKLHLEAGDNICNPKLLAAFRTALAGQTTERTRPQPLDVKAKKDLLQKGTVRENLTKKIYAGGRKRKRAW
nr:chaperone protein DnaJ [Tanacetum cinerariifolium]